MFAKAVNSTAIFVNWTEPAEMNGHLVNYQVCLVLNTSIYFYPLGAKSAKDDQH